MKSSRLRLDGRHSLKRDVDALSGKASLTALGSGKPPTESKPV
jgi:hypothetical protein